MTDPLLAEIDALLKIMEFRGTYDSDEVKNILLGIRQKIIEDRERMIERLKAWESTCVKKQNYNGAQAFKIAGEVVMNDEEQLRGKS